MKNIIQRILIALITAIFAVTAMAACSAIPGIPNSSTSSMSAAEVVEAHFTALYENRFDDALSYADEASLMLINALIEPTETWRRRVADMHFENDVIFEGILVESIDSIDYFEGFRVRVRLTVNGENTIIDEPDQYVVRESDGYKVIVGNVIGASDTSQHLTRNIYNSQIKIITSYAYTVNGYAVIIEYENNTDINYRFGWINPGSVLIETDVSIYSEDLPFGATISAYSSDRIVAWLPNASGEVRRISATNLIELNARGLPSRTGNAGETIVLWDIDTPLRGTIVDDEIFTEDDEVLEMPDMAGWCKNDAMDYLSALELDLHIITESLEGDEGSGIVIETNPSYGTPLTIGDTVTIKYRSSSELQIDEVPDENEENNTSGNIGSFSNNTFEIIVTSIQQAENRTAVSYEIHNNSSREISMFGYPSIIIDENATQAEFFDNTRVSHTTRIPSNSYVELTLYFNADISGAQSIRMQGSMFSMGNFSDLSFNITIEP